MKQQCTATVRFPGADGDERRWTARSQPHETPQMFLRAAAVRLLQLAQDLDTPEAQEGTQDAPGSTPEAPLAQVGVSLCPPYSQAL